MKYFVDDKVIGRLSNTAFQMSNPINFLESFRPNQVTCKRWLVEEISTCNIQYDNVLVLGSWNGCLLWELMNTVCEVRRYTFVDIDPVVHKERDFYFEVNNIKKNYHSVVADASAVCNADKYDLVINTSAEHIKDIHAVYGPLYAVQSNNYTQVPEHINCVNSTAELSKKTKITRQLYKGEKNMGHYTRFMVVGYHI